MTELATTGPLGWPGRENQNYPPTAYTGHDAGSLHDYLQTKVGTLLQEKQDLLNLNTSLQARVEELGIDLVTGLPTRRLLEEEYERIVRPHPTNRRSELRPASDEEHSVLFLDVDNFGEVNKRHGEPVGDVALRRVADVMRRRIRHNDISGRYGGEELVAILPRTGIASAKTVAENVREEIEETAPFDDVARLTASVGVGRLIVASSLKEGVVEANRAMHYAKDTGKNRVVSYEDF